MTRPHLILHMTRSHLAALLMTRPHHAQRSMKKAYSRRNYRPSIGSRLPASTAATGPQHDLVELGEVGLLICLLI